MASVRQTIHNPTGHTDILLEKGEELAVGMATTKSDFPDMKLLWVCCPL